MNQLDVLKSSVKSLNQGSLFFASLTAPIIRRDLTMNEKSKSEIMEKASNFVKKYGPTILVGAGAAMMIGSIRCTTRAKAATCEALSIAQKEHDKYNNRIVEKYSVDEYITKHHRIPVTEEERKYCNWMTYEKEASIYEAYEEFKSMEDFG